MMPQIDTSPMFIENTIYYYVGDTFQVSFFLDLKDETGSSIEILSSDTVTFEFYNSSDMLVYVAEMSSIEGNTVLLDWTDNVTDKFKKGVYTYRVKLNSEYVTTIAADYGLVVI